MMRWILNEMKKPPEPVLFGMARDFFNEHFRNKTVDFKYYSEKDDAYEFVGGMKMVVGGMSAVNEFRAGFQYSRCFDDGGRGNKDFFGFSTDGAVFKIDNGALVIDAVVENQKMRYRFEKSKD